MKAKYFFIPMGILAIGAISGCSSTESGGSPSLEFDADNFKVATLTMPSGDTVEYKAYEGIYYVENAGAVGPRKLCREPLQDVPLGG